MFKICLPISHLFNGNPSQIEKFINIVDALEIKFVKDYFFPKQKERLFHAPKGIIEHDFIPFLEENRIFDYLQKHNVRLFSFDLGPACEMGQSILPTSITLKKEEIYRIAGERLKYIRRYFSGLLAVENLNYYKTGLFEHICEPEFITDFIKNFDLHFLLDLAHANISAHNLKYALYEYLNDLPLDRVIEIHLSRPFINSFVSVDAHDCPLKEDFRILEWVMSKIEDNRTVYIVIEYYKDIEKLLAIYNDLQKRLNKVAKVK